MTPKIAIIDYGINNLHSLAKAFAYWNIPATITEDVNYIKNADAVVLPGTGAFKAGMESLSRRNLTGAIQEFAAGGAPVLGICLGAQLLLSRGQEFGNTLGLNIIKGSVIPFPRLSPDCKVPHFGWNNLKPLRKNELQKDILTGFRENSTVYFVHSFIFRPENQEEVLATTEYGGCEFPSVLRSGNIYGCQFHPEKSGKTGLNIIRNFINQI